MKVNLIPMAGMGQRFLNEGYNIPKPLIEIDGLPMVVRAWKSLPPADKNILICQSRHIKEYPIKKILKNHIPNLTIIEINGLTEGQAITCLAAENHIPKNSILTIGASDNDMTYDHSKIDSMINNSSIDGWIWTFRKNPTVLKDPYMYGWVLKNSINKNAIGISCKKPISKNPINDHAVIGAFTFKKSQYFFE